jgi:hypothetical protein
MATPGWSYRVIPYAHSGKELIFVPLWTMLTHTFGENSHMMGVNLGCDSMSKVEDMASAFSETGERFFYLVFNDFGIR